MKGRYQSGLVLILVFCLLGPLQAQRRGDLPPGSLQEQFNHLDQESGRYQNSKVVPQAWLDAFWGNVQKTLREQGDSIKQDRLEIDNLNKKINDLQQKTATLNEQVDTLKQEKNSLGLLGITIDKSVYHTLVWTLIGALSAGLIFFLGRFRYANSATRETRSENQELQEKVEQLRRRMLEKEQELRRQLQDEINKRLG